MKLEATHTVKLVYCTTSSMEEAQRLGTMLVEQQLAACVNILPTMHSIYRWQGAIESATEAVLLVKTLDGHLQEVLNLIDEHHSYECPAFLVLPVEAGADHYLQWLREQVKPKKTESA